MLHHGAHIVGLKELLALIPVASRGGKPIEGTPDGGSPTLTAPHADDDTSPVHDLYEQVVSQVCVEEFDESRHSLLDGPGVDRPPDVAEQPEPFEHPLGPQILDPLRHPPV